MVDANVCPATQVHHVYVRYVIQCTLFCFFEMILFLENVVCVC